MWCIGGILVTILTYASASSSGGHYIVAHGAILFGAFRFIRGLVSKTTKPKRKTVGYQDTAYHANLQPEAHTQPLQPDQKN